MINTSKAKILYTLKKNKFYELKLPEQSIHNFMGFDMYATQLLLEQL